MREQMRNKDGKHDHGAGVKKLVLKVNA